MADSGPAGSEGNNPVLYVDSDGRAWDIFLDIGFLAYDIGSAIYNHITGNHQQAKQNWVDVGLDKAFGSKSDEYTNLIIEISEES